MTPVAVLRVGNRRSEQIPQTSSSRPQQCGGSSEQSLGGGGEVKDSTEQDEADEQGRRAYTHTLRFIIVIIQM